MPSEPAKADVWNRLADGGRALLIGGAVIAPLWRKDFRRTFDGVTAVVGIHAACKGIKAFWQERRPNGENNDSFPSQHAGDCFAAAVILDKEWRDTIGPAAVGLATAVCMARVFAGKHHVADVIAGASLGVIAGELASAIDRPRSGRTR